MAAPAPSLGDGGGFVGVLDTISRRCGGCCCCSARALEAAGVSGGLVGGERSSVWVFVEGDFATVESAEAEGNSWVI